MKLLLTGADGQVGREVARLATAHDVQVVGLNHLALDISHRQAVHTAISEHRPDLVVNAAAYTAVDGAEDERENAFAANRDGPANLADACDACKIPLIHLSTDYVFDGQSQTPCGEEDTVGPRNVYGQSKLEGERAIADRLQSHLILRVSWVFSSHGRNFVKTILRLARKNEELRVVSDQHGCPTAASDIAGVVIDLATRIEKDKAENWGIYHFRGAPPTTWYDFSRSILEEARKHVRLAARAVLPISTAEYPTRAPRPIHSVLDCGRIMKSFGIEPSPWQPALKRTIEEICRE